MHSSLAGAGTKAVTGVGFQPTMVLILAPVFVSLLLLLAYGISRLADLGGRRAALALGMLILALSAFGQGSNLAEARKN